MEHKASIMSLFLMSLQAKDSRHFQQLLFLEKIRVLTSYTKMFWIMSSQNKLNLSKWLREARGYPCQDIGQAQPNGSESSDQTSGSDQPNGSIYPRVVQLPDLPDIIC